MASEAVSTAILIIAGVIVATAIASAIYSQASLMGSAMRTVLKASEDRIRTEVRIVHLAVNSSGGISHLLVFVKNTGSRGVSSAELSRSDMYIGSSTCSDAYLYSSEPVGGRPTWSFSIIDVDRDGVWSPGETAVVRIFNSTAINPPICAKIVLPNGVVHEVLYSP